MDPQTALDAPRFCIGLSRSDAASIVLLEDGLSGSIYIGQTASRIPAEG